MSPKTIPLMRSDAPKILTKLVMVLAGMPGQRSRSICVKLSTVSCLTLMQGLGRSASGTSLADLTRCHRVRAHFTIFGH